MNKKLTTTDHSRDIAGLKYIYPVISRRAGGLSIGINFNTNNACNWRCIYCQVPGLVRGVAPDLDFNLLEQEFRFFLNEVLNGNFFNQFNVDVQHRIIKDIAISGNGEPTSLKDFDKAVELIGQIATEQEILPERHFVLITNGSLMQRQCVQDGLKILNKYHGEVWFKLDSTTEHGRKKINGINLTNKKTLENLKISSGLCETRLQTCLLNYMSIEDAENEAQSYLDLLKTVKLNQIELKKVLLYTIARPSFQPEAKNIYKVDAKVMDQFSDKLMSLGYEVTISS